MDTLPTRDAGRCWNSEAGFCRTVVHLLLWKGRVPLRDVVDQPGRGVFGDGPLPPPCRFSKYFDRFHVIGASTVTGQVIAALVRFAARRSVHSVFTRISRYSQRWFC